MIAAELLKQRTLETVLKRYDWKIKKNTHRAEYVECLIANLFGNAWTLLSRAERTPPLDRRAELGLVVPPSWLRHDP